MSSVRRDLKSTRLNSSHANISYAVFCLKKKGLRPDGLEVLPELAGAFGIGGVVGADRGPEHLAVFGGEVVGVVPGEVGDLAADGQVPQRRVVHVGAQRQAVAGVCQAGPGAGGLVGLAVVQHVGQVVLDPGQPQYAGQAQSSGDGSRRHRQPAAGSAAVGCGGNACVPSGCSGLPASGRVPRRQDPGSGRAEALLMTEAQTPRAPAGAGGADDDAAEGRVYTVSGEDWDELIAAPNSAAMSPA